MKNDSGQGTRSGKFCKNKPYTWFCCVGCYRLRFGKHERYHKSKTNIKAASGGWSGVPRDPYEGKIRAGSYIERWLAKIPDRTQFLYNCPEIGKNNSKIDRKVYLNSVSVMFALALFQDDLKVQFPNPTLISACGQSSYFSQNTHFQHVSKKSIFYKVPRPSPQTKNDRTWILLLRTFHPKHRFFCTCATLRATSCKNSLFQFATTFGHF